MLNHTSLKQGSLMIKCGKLDSWIVTVNVGRTTLFFFFFLVALAVAPEPRILI